MRHWNYIDIHPWAASHIPLPPRAHLEVFRKHSALPVATRAGLDVASGTAHGRTICLWDSGALECVIEIFKAPSVISDLIARVGETI